MDSADIFPQLLFFFFFFLAFSVMELILVFILNRLMRKYWEFVVDRVMRLKVHYGNAIRNTAVISIVLLVALLCAYTPIIRVLAQAYPSLQSFAIAMVFTMVLIYFATARKMAKLVLEKRIHQYLYFVVSLILYVFFVIFANESYVAYRQYINTQLVSPTIENVRAGLDERKKEDLLNKFREEARAGKCLPIDYSKVKGTGVKQFLFMAQDAEFAVSGSMVVPQGVAALKGRSCTDGENTFLLTDEGRWYWVISGTGN